MRSVSGHRACLPGLSRSALHSSETVLALLPSGQVASHAEEGGKVEMNLDEIQKHMQERDFAANGVFVGQLADETRAQANERILRQLADDVPDLVAEVVTLRRDLYLERAGEAVELEQLKLQNERLQKIAEIAKAHQCAAKRYEVEGKPLTRCELCEALSEVTQTEKWPHAHDGQILAIVDGVPAFVCTDTCHPEQRNSVGPAGPAGGSGGNYPATDRRVGGVSGICPRCKQPVDNVIHFCPVQ